MNNIDLSLDMDALEIISQTVDTQGNIVIEMQRKATSTSCHKCGKTAMKRYGFFKPESLF